MPKRPSSSSTSPRKKSKQQPNLDSFFRSPSKQQPHAGDASTSSRPHDTSSSLNSVPSSEVIDDAHFARQLAESEGLTLETLQRLESQWKSQKKVFVSRGEDTTTGNMLDSEAGGVRQSYPVQPPPEILSPKPTPPSVPDEPRGGPSSWHQNTDAVTPAYGQLDCDPAAFRLRECPWNRVPHAPFSFLAHTLATLAETRSRIRILDTVTNSLCALLAYDPTSLLPALYLLSNALAPPYAAVEMGLGHAVLQRAIQQISGLTPNALKRLYNKHGDPGDVAFEAKTNVRTLVPHLPLTIAGVYEAMLKIANAKGQGAGKQKQATVEKLLVSARGEETRYLVRSLVQNNRVGAARTSILTALARSLVLTRPSTAAARIPSDSGYHASEELLARVRAFAEETKAKSGDRDTAQQEVAARFASAEALLKKVYVQRPDYGAIVEALLDVGLDGLAERVPLTVGVPLHPTLGSPTRSLDEIYDRLGDLSFAAEFKYDGQRAQIHVWSDTGVPHVKIFSRHLEDMTDKYPDVVSCMRDVMSDAPDLASFILDAEIVAIDPADGGLRSFQTLANRARKAVVGVPIAVAVGVFAFDLLYLAGESLLGEPFRTRRRLLRSRLHPRAGAARFSHVESVESSDGRDVVEEFWMRAVEGRCEGLMIKLLDNGEAPEEAGTSPGKGRSRRKPLPATYEPDKRTSAWLKLKKDYVVGLGDSLDLVPIGAWHGNGRKAQWWSPILLAVRNQDSGQFVAMCKCMSGFTDVFYKALREKHDPDSTDECSRQNVWGVETGGLRPEVYFRPQEVWEIRGADITLSPVSVAAMGLVADRGCSLRFPRFIKIRQDKTTEEASTAELLAEMYRKQEARGRNNKGADEGDLVDVPYESEPGSEDENSSEDG